MGVVVIGSLNVDLATDVDRLPQPGETVATTRPLRRTPGGKGLNQAIAAARQGADVRLVGLVGDDGDGRWLVERLDAEAIDTNAIATTTDAATGLALITVDAHGDNTIVVVPGANAALQAPTFTVTRDDVVLAQLEVPIHTVTLALAAAHAAGATTILNASPITGPLPPELLETVDVLVVNELEHRVTGPGPRTTVVTRGERGATLLRRPDDASPVHLEPHAVTAIDSTGAGDAFAGTLAAALAAGSSDLATGLQRANAAGALAVTNPGAADSLPTSSEVDELLRSSSSSSSYKP